MNDVKHLMAMDSVAQAESDYAQALMDPETPDQAAVRLRKARMFDLTPEQTPSITPAEEAVAKAQAVNWAAMYTEAPTLMERLSQPAFANLVKDDLSSMTAMERTLWQLSPDAGEKDSLWGTVRNAFSRGGYSGLATSLFGSLSDQESYAKELDRVQKIEREIAEGKDVSHYFVTAEDETGKVGLAAFLADKDRIKTTLSERIDEAAHDTARRVRYAALFPEAKATREMMAQGDIESTIAAFAKDPLTILADIGVSSMAQQAPQLAMLPLLGGAGGMPAQILGTFAFSAEASKQSKVMEHLAEEGIDLTDADAIAAAYKDPLKRDMLTSAIKRAEQYAMGPALLDAASVGLAGKFLAPKSVTRNLLDSAYKREFANMAIQMPVQGAMGGAGEALGQYASDGEISSWSEVFAEFVGEHFTAPYEVLTTGVKARAQADRERLLATMKAQRLAELKGVQAGTAQRDPETMTEFQNEVARRASVETVEFDAQSFHQLGLDTKFSSIPEVQAQMPEALAKGGTIRIPTSTYINKMLPEDEKGETLEIVSVGGTPSVAEATEQGNAIEAHAELEAKKALKEERRAFNKEVAEVGKLVGTDLRRLGITREEARNIQALVQLHVANTARLADMSPKAFWDKYGSRYLGEPDVTKTENGVRVKGEVLGADSVQQGAKGDFFPTLRIIARWKGADRSTLLHETGHMFLDMRTRLATDLLASENLTKGQKELVGSVKDVLEWLGVGDMDAWNSLSVKEQEAYHEKFARSFEAYVMEGKAPTSRLERAFRAFASWLKELYSVFANIPGAELDDDVRAMFDALFVSQEAIREAQMRQAIQPLFVRAADAGLSATEWDEYQQSQQDIVTKAEAELAARNIRLQKGAKNMRNRLLQELRRARRGRIAEIRDQVEAEYMQSRAYQAWNKLANGMTVDGEEVRIKISFDSLKALGLKPSQIKKLHDARLASAQAYRQRMPIEALATALGYPNPQELVKDLLANANPKEVIEQQTLKRLIAESPELESEATMRDMADAAIFNDAKVKVVSTELAAMERMLNRQGRTEAAAIDALAYAAVQRAQIAGLKPITHVRAANRAARNARKAWAKGAIAEAVSFKRQELYQAALAKHAREALMSISKEVKNFKKYKAAQNKGMDTKILVLIQRALANMGVYSEKALHLNEATEPFAKELADLEAELTCGLAVSENMLKAITEKDRSVLETVGGMRAFIGTIKSLEAQARRERAVNTIEGRKELEAVQAEASQAVRENAAAKGRNVRKDMEKNGKKEQFKDLLTRIGFNHARAAALVAVLDGAWDGVLSKLLIYPADKCGNTEETLKNKYATKLDKILSAVKESLTNNTARTSKVFKHAFTVQEVFVLLLNYGNEGNRQRALATVSYLTGYQFFEGVDPKKEAEMAKAQARADALMRALFAEYLTDEHYDAAEQIWALFEELKGTTGKVQREIAGREPEWVDATPLRVVTPDGERVLSGGYYPIAYDRKASLVGAGLQETDTLKSMQPLFGKGGVSDGWTKSRAKVFDHALVLTSRAMFEGLDEQIHYVSWASFINNARKLLKHDGELAQTIVAHYGTAYFKALERWLEDCRNGSRGQATTTDVIANELRRNVSLAGVGLNFGTAALQLVGITQSIAYLGGQWAGRGVSEFMRLGPTGAFKAVSAKSEMMQNRMRTQFRELTEIQSRLSGGTGDLKDKFMRAAYMPLSVMQLAVDLPTWLGAYQKAVHEGKGEEESIAYADRAVMNSQGSGRMQDLSELERGNAWAKLFTVFYTFFNTALNMAVVSGKTEEGMKRACTLLMILVMQPVIESFLKSAVGAMAGGDDEDWLKKALKDASVNTLGFNLSMLVGVRELSYLTGDFGYQGPAGLRKIGDTGRAIRAWDKAWENGEISESTVKATVSAMGVWVGLPVTPINRAISGGNALYRGDTDNPLALFLGYSDK